MPCQHMYGADADELDRIARIIHNAADDLADDTNFLSWLVRDVPWFGPIASLFVSNWQSRHMNRLQRAVAFLHVTAEGLTRNAAQQREASNRSWLESGSGPGGSPGSGSHGSGSHGSGSTGSGSHGSGSHGSGSSGSGSQGSGSSSGQSGDHGGGTHSGGDNSHTSLDEHRRIHDMFHSEDHDGSQGVGHDDHGLGGGSGGGQSGGGGTSGGGGSPSGGGGSPSGGGGSPSGGGGSDTSGAAGDAGPTADVGGADAAKGVESVAAAVGRDSAAAAMSPAALSSAYDSLGASRMIAGLAGAGAGGGLSLWQGAGMLGMVGLAMKAAAMSGATGFMPGSGSTFDRIRQVMRPRGLQTIRRIFKEAIMGNDCFGVNSNPVRIRMVK